MSDYIKKMNRRGCNGFKNYIEQIRFPFYKKITRDQVIHFDYPFTALVGPNGSGKTSVLQALYGATRGNSVSDFWFSTSIDPIEESGSDINRFIYKFKPEEHDEKVEVLNKRTQRNKTEKQEADPDYWESARPSIRDGMEKMPDNFDESLKEIRTKTRWRPIDKKVTYIDFRAEISAFDKCFYFGYFEKTRTIKNKKDFLRSRSKALSKGIDSGAPFLWHKRLLKNVRELNSNELSWTNKILGKNYVAAKIVSHNFFNQDGFSIIFITDDNSYSEAVAGSGEVAVVTSVIKILESESHSLILLDEPEVSLHPGAQLKLRDLLFHKVNDDTCQVVVSTHSESFLQDLPSKAIKLFYRDKVNHTYSVAPEASAEQAFFRIGGERASSRIIYVEDKLAKLLVEAAIKEIDEHALKDFTITPYPGGAPTIIKDLAINFALSSATESNSIVLLDGDVNPNVSKIRSKNISESDLTNLNSIFQSQTTLSTTALNLPLSGGNMSPEVKAKQRNDLLLKTLDAFHDHFNFMNVDTPEELIWNISSASPMLRPLVENIDTAIPYKERFVELAKEMNSESINSDHILQAQDFALMKRDKTHNLWIEFKDLLKNILQINEI